MSLPPSRRQIRSPRLHLQRLPDGQAKPYRKQDDDVWTWTAIDADSKLIVSWLLGKRDANCALKFMRDIGSRLKYRVQLTTDGHKPYLNAVEEMFGSAIDYAMLDSYR